MEIKTCEAYLYNGSMSKPRSIRKPNLREITERNEETVVTSLSRQSLDAVTLDFYTTLVYHKEGSSRGAMLMDYLSDVGLESDPWEHQVLYDIFSRHREEYSPSFGREDKRRYLVQLTQRLFARLNVRAPETAAAQHTSAIWQVLGPTSLGVFPEVIPVLDALRRASLKTAVVSNWQCGLLHFCAELGIGELVDHVLASADVGCAKPDPKIFLKACGLMRVEPHRVVHVGDSVIDDIDGASGAGMRSVLVLRDGSESSVTAPTVPHLGLLPEMLGLT